MRTLSIVILTLLAGCASVPSKTECVTHVDANGRVQACESDYNETQRLQEASDTFNSYVEEK